MIHMLCSKDVSELRQHDGKSGPNYKPLEETAVNLAVERQNRSKFVPYSRFPMRPRGVLCTFEDGI